MAESEYLTTDAIAAELNVSTELVQSWFRTGSLPGRKVGKSWTTTRRALDAWIEGHPTQPLETTPPLNLETK